VPTVAVGTLVLYLGLTGNAHADSPSLVPRLTVGTRAGTANSSPLVPTSSVSPSPVRAQANPTTKIKKIDNDGGLQLATT